MTPDHARGRVLHELVGRDPGRCAVRAGGRECTYAELDEAANRLAHHLRAYGAEAGTVTAIRLPRGLDLPVAILAALKAGTAYLPLDPRQPAGRQLHLLREADVRLLLTTREPRLDAPVETVFLDDPLVRARPATAPAVPVTPDSLAYLLPTSGTTGGVKLVEMPHGAAANTLAHVGDGWGVGPGDVVLQLADIGYSAAVRDILGPLVNGATLELLPESGARAVEAVARRLAAGGVTCLLSCLPQVLSALIDLDAPRGDLRLVVAISEPLGARLVERVRRAWGPQVRLVHQYGLTECAMTSLADDVPADVSALDRVPVGRPIPNTRAYLLDHHQRPVPPGTTAELYLAGAGLARGYHRQPHLTATRFLPDPFHPGTRMYRTGDLARQHPDGTIEYLGRTDRQIKIRGYRVELDEIELALRAHPGLREAAVHAYHRGGEPVVVGYLVPRDGVPPTPVDLATALAGTLPEPLTALRYVTLPELPKLPNGKIDRLALPEPPATGDTAAPVAGEAAAVGGEAAAVGGEAAVEEAISAAWKAVLGRTELDPHDDVFALGAHSMQVVRVTARLRRALAAPVQVRDVFEHRSVAALTARLTHLRPAPADKPEAARRARPVTAAQRGLWFLSRLRPGGAAYTIAFALDVDATVDIAGLRDAVERVVRHHPALRTTFDDQGGEPAAVVHETPRFEFTVADVEEQSWAARPFDLSSGPLLRVAVHPDGTTIRFALHHIIADDWSVGVLLRDLTTAYDGGSLPVPHAVRAAEPPAAPAGWLARLRAAPPLVRLPADRPAPAVATDGGGVVWRTLPPSLVDAVDAVASANRATPYMVLLAAWSLLLSRWCVEDELLVGMLSAGRTAPHADDAIGLFVNTVPVPVAVDPAAGFDELVRRTRASVLDALQHADVPFERLVERLAPRRGAAHAPLVQVACDWLDEPPERWHLGDSVARLRDIEPPVAKFDLWLSLRRRGATVRARLEYRTDLFTAATAELLADRLETLLRAATGAPDRPVATLDVMPPAERERVVVEWNDTAVRLRAGSILDLLRGHDGIAVRHGDRAMTYAELHAASDHLAGHLCGHGLGADDIVAVCLPRTPELVVAILAVLKAGAAYLPLDPAYPAPRLTTILAAATPAVLVAAGDLDPAIGVPAGTRVLVPERLPPAGTAPFVPPAPPDLDNLAYVLFTSGSTGVPKGVALTHRGLLNLVEWAGRRFSAAEHACVAASTSVCFDLSVFELFTPLSGGGTIDLLDDLLSLAASPASARVTLLNTVPSAIAALLDTRPELPLLRRVNVAGEPLRPELVDRIAAALPGRGITNLYGPTETATYSTAADCAPGASVTIGRPIANTRAYLLDQHQRPVPPGTTAELYLAGAGLARGYHRQPHLTATRFLPDPFHPGTRMYRTGDLARQHPDGTIEYLGRTDRQIKIRGYRVEPAEVETALLAHPAVRQAAAGPYPEPSGALRLVAWVVLDDPRVNGADLRQFLDSRLARFLVPSVITPVAAMPLNRNGKIDWAALPPPEPGGSPAAAAGPAPLTVAEQAVARLWRELLGRDALDPASHFFDLGAHSLMAIRLMSRINQTFGVDLPVSLVFAAPRLGELARRVEDAVLRDIIDRRGAGEDG